jgi:hypothetical protein
LIAGAPYHSEYLDGVTDTVKEDLEDEELWEAKDLKIPVYNTENGISECLSLPNLGAYYTELFNSLDIKYESCWNKKWAPCS